MKYQKKSCARKKNWKKIMIMKCNLLDVFQLVIQLFLLFLLAIITGCSCNKILHYPACTVDKLRTQLQEYTKNVTLSIECALPELPNGFFVPLDQLEEIEIVSGTIMYRMFFNECIMRNPIMRNLEIIRTFCI